MRAKQIFFAILIALEISIGLSINKHLKIQKSRNTPSFLKQKQSRFNLNEIDQNSFSNIDQIKLLHYHVDLDVDFDRQQLKGFVLMDFQVQEKGIDKIILDVQDQTIHSVELLTLNGDQIGEEMQNPQFLVNKPEEDEFLFIGQQLVINLPEQLSRYLIKYDDITLQINYETGPYQTAMSFLYPEQTETKSHNYLFTQCESIGCRSIIPIQDSPQVKSTYSANITVPMEYEIFLSAQKVGSYDKIVQDEFAENGVVNKKTIEFVQDIKIPSYLFAMVVGNLQQKQISYRTYVIAEPSQIRESSVILEDLESYVKSVENYIGNYQWGDYKVVVMPNSFPFGGMENPLLTFVTPHIITKNKQKLYVVIHEIAHSWFGNTVTCENWENIWLNEGLTTFLEHKGVKSVYGKDIYNLTTYISQKSLNKTVEQFEKSGDQVLTQLVPSPNLYHPDQYISQIPYDKGYMFALYLESVVGADNFQKFLRSYIANFGMQSINSEDFKQYFLEYFENIYIYGFSNIQWDQWLYGQGKAPVNFNYRNKLVNQAENIAIKYYQGQYDVSSQFKDLHNLQKSLVLSKFKQFGQDGELDDLLIDQIESDFKLMQQENKSLLAGWLLLKIKYRDHLSQNDLDQIGQYLQDQGMGSVSAQFYQALLEQGYEQFAIFQFNGLRNFYHYQTQFEIMEVFEQYGVDLDQENNNSISTNDGELNNSNQINMVQKYKQQNILSRKYNRYTVDIL